MALQKLGEPRVLDLNATTASVTYGEVGYKPWYPGHGFAIFHRCDSWALPLWVSICPIEGNELADQGMIWER